MTFGLKDWQIILHERFPDAYLAMFDGIKFTVNIGKLVSQYLPRCSGGLGNLVFELLASMNTGKIEAGALPAITIAIFIGV